MKQLWQQIQPWVFWGITQQALYTWIGGFSAKFSAFFANPLKLGQVRCRLSVDSNFQVSPEMLNRVQVGLWLGLSMAFTDLSLLLAMCLGSLSCWKVNPQPSLRSWGTLLHSAFPQPWPVSQSWPLKNTPQHGAATSTPYFCDGTLQVMTRAGFLQRWCLELRFIRPENLVSQSPRVL